MNAFSADQLIEKIRAEALRSNGSETTPARRSTETVPGLFNIGGKSVPANFARRQEYVATELTDFPDRLFIRAAYLAALGREPDSAGLRHHADSLRRAEMTKLQLLRLLHGSDEGHKKNAVIHGLDADQLAEARERKRFIGKLYRIFAIFRQLPRLDREQRRMNASLEEMLVNNRDAKRDLDENFRAMRGSLEADLAAVTTQTTRLMQEFAAISSQFRAQDNLRAELTRQAQTMQAVADRLESLTSQMTGFGAAIHSVRAVASRQQAEILSVARPATIYTASSAPEAPASDALYASLRDHLRPPAARLQTYLPYLARAVVETDCDEMLDLCPAHGEWLHVVREAGYRGTGLDANQPAALLNELRMLDEGRFAFVSGLQLIERLSPDQLILVLDEVRRVLRPAGMVLLETPNGRNLQVALDQFHRDPARLRPVHPDTLSWLGEARGFVDGAVFYVNGAASMAPAARWSFRRLRDLVASPPDYVWIARKAGLSG